MSQLNYIPWEDTKHVPQPQNCKRGAHGKIVISVDGKIAYKIIKKKHDEKLSYEFIMELIVRERCMDIPVAQHRIVPVLKVFEMPKFYVLCMPCINNACDLYDTITSNKLLGVNVRGIMEDIMQAMHVMHARGIAWRDVKDANVLLTWESDCPRAYICDFSIATFTPHLPRSLFVPYTSHFRPPEVRRYVTHRNDVIMWKAADTWALGALLARIMVGKYVGNIAGPFPPKRDAFCHMTPDFPEKHVILQMMNKNPAKRPTVAQAMQAMGMVPIDVSPMPSPTPVVPFISDCAKQWCAHTNAPPWVEECAHRIMRFVCTDDNVIPNAEVTMACLCIATKLCMLMDEHIFTKYANVGELVQKYMRDPATRQVVHASVFCT